MTKIPPKQILFLRVGIDKRCGGALAPIFASGDFEFVPIPENQNKTSIRSIRFNQLNARIGGTLEQFVPKRYQQEAAHYDPEFETFTYGDPSRNKRGQLLRLDKWDYLVFYAGLTPYDFSGSDRLYIIGYFTVKRVYDIQKSEEWPPNQFMHLANNAHLRRNTHDSGLVIVEGQHDCSYLFQKAVPFSNESYAVLPELADLVGFSGSVMRAGAGRWVPTSKVNAVKQWLITLE